MLRRSGAPVTVAAWPHQHHALHQHDGSNPNPWPPQCEEFTFLDVPRPPLVTDKGLSRVSPHRAVPREREATRPGAGNERWTPAVSTPAPAGSLRNVALDPTKDYRPPGHRPGPPPRIAAPPLPSADKDAGPGVLQPSHAQTAVSGGGSGRRNPAPLLHFAAALADTSRHIISTVGDCRRS
jgi:hypothetical protein